jgi:hypothetical protein
MKTETHRTECLNPNTGGRMSIDKEIYDLFAKAIKQTLKDKKALTFSEMVEGIKNYLSSNKIKFSKSVGWYAVTVKNDLEVRKEIEAYIEKGKKLHRLNKK